MGNKQIVHQLCGVYARIGLDRHFVLIGIQARLDRHKDLLLVAHFGEGRGRGLIGQIAFDQQMRPLLPGNAVAVHIALGGLESERKRAVRRIDLHQL